MTRFVNYIPFQLSLFLAIGIQLGFNIELEKQLLATFILVFMTFLWLFFWMSKTKVFLRLYFKLVVFLFSMALGFTAVKLHLSTYQKNHYSHFVSPSSTIVFQITDKLRSNTYNTRYYATVLQVDSTPVQGSLLVNLPKRNKDDKIQIGTVFITNKPIKALKIPLNPYVFNYKKYLQTKGIQYQVRVNDSDLIQLEPTSYSLQVQAKKWRSFLSESLDQYAFTTAEKSVIKALVLGEKQAVSKDLSQQYAKAGVIHILAVSGLHIAILFYILSFIFRPLEQFKNGRVLKLILIVLLLWTFALLTGLSASVVRAVTMFNFIAVGSASKHKKRPVLHALFASFLFLLLVNPLFLFDVGFQLSYAAVLSIVLLQPKLLLLFPNTNFWFLKKIEVLFSVSMAATLGTLPLSLYYFHQFPGLFFVSNVVIVPFVGLIMSIGILVVMLASFGMLPEFLAKVYAYILDTLNFVVNGFASQEDFLFTNITFSLAALLATYFLFISGYLVWDKQKVSRLYLFLVAVISWQVVAIIEKKEAIDTNEFVVFNQSKESVIGVRQGRKILLLHSLDSSNSNVPYAVSNYVRHERIKHVSQAKLIPNQLVFKHKRIFIVDSLGVYQNLNTQPDIVLLRQSPKVNIDRLLQELKPQILVADASNYKSYVQSWALNCAKHQVEFHYTGIDAALLLH